MSPDQEVRGKLQPIAAAIKDQLPPGWGLALFVFPVDGREGNLNYISTAERETMVLALVEWLARNGATPEMFGKFQEEIL